VAGVTPAERDHHVRPKGRDAVFGLGTSRQPGNQRGRKTSESPAGERTAASKDAPPYSNWNGKITQQIGNGIDGRSRIRLTEEKSCMPLYSGGPDL